MVHECLLLVKGSADAAAHATRANRVVGEALQGGGGQVEELLPQQEGLKGTGLHWDLEEGGRMRPLHAGRQLRLRKDAAGGRKSASPRVENELRERERIHHGEQLGGRGGLDERRAHFETLLICEQDGVVVVMAEVLRHGWLRLAAEPHFVV